MARFFLSVTPSLKSTGQLPEKQYFSIFPRLSPEGPRPGRAGQTALHERLEGLLDGLRLPFRQPPQREHARIERAAIGPSRLREDRSRRTGGERRERAGERV